MKKYDLMNQINARGTYLVSKCALPYLKASKKNPQILNISPPLNMKPRWFRDHCAYTMAKYGMSMCVLGMSEEFKPYGIGVNALWPQTGKSVYLDGKRQPKLFDGNVFSYHHCGYGNVGWWKRCCQTMPFTRHHV